MRLGANGPGVLGQLMDMGLNLGEVDYLSLTYIDDNVSLINEFLSSGVMFRRLQTLAIHT